MTPAEALSILPKPMQAVIERIVQLENGRGEERAEAIRRGALTSMYSLSEVAHAYRLYLFAINQSSKAMKP